MHTPRRYDYAVIRVVPRVERDEFVNVGVIVSCESQRYLEARIELDLALLHAFAPALDVESVSDHLASIPRICAGVAGSGPIGQLPIRARFHWLTATRSSVVQTSPVHSGICRDLPATLQHLMQRMVLRPR